MLPFGPRRKVPVFDAALTVSAVAVQFRTPAVPGMYVGGGGLLLLLAIAFSVEAATAAARVLECRRGSGAVQECAPTESNIGSRCSGPESGSYSYGTDPAW